MLSLVQLTHPNWGRRAARVAASRLDILECASTYALARTALDSRTPLVDLAADAPASQTADYDEVYNGASEWSLLPAFVSIIPTSPPGVSWQAPD